jgi:hypothetical protein
MKLAEGALENLEFIRQTISSISNGSYDEEVGEPLFRLKCNNIRMEAEISTILYPEQIRPCLQKYHAELGNHMLDLFWLQILNDEEKPLTGIHAVEDMLNRLMVFIKGQIDES